MLRLRPHTSLSLSSSQPFQPPALLFSPSSSSPQSLKALYHSLQTSRFNLNPSLSTRTMILSLNKLALLTGLLCTAANAATLQERATAFFSPLANGGSMLDDAGGGLGEPLNVRSRFPYLLLAFARRARSRELLPSFVYWCRLQGCTGRSVGREAQKCEGQSVGREAQSSKPEGRSVWTRLLL